MRLAVLSLLLVWALAGCSDASQREHQKTMEQLAAAVAACDTANQALAAKETELTKTKELLDTATDALAKVGGERDTFKEQLEAEKDNAAKLADANTKLTQANADAAGELAAAKQKIAELETLVKKLQPQVAPAPTAPYGP